MAASQTDVYKNTKREIAKSLSRQGMFISEYVQFKYKDLYREAGMMYNELNKQYPHKPDLRKTKEFRHWKNEMAKANGERPSYIPREKKYKYKRTAYWDIALEDSESTPEAPSRTSDKTMCLNIPLLDASNYKPSRQTIIEEGDQSANQEDDQSANQEDDQTADIDQVMAPSILDGIATETIQRIIQELRTDPNLRDIMEDIDQEISTTQDVEEEIIGLEVDLPELYDRLEEELDLW